VTWLKRWQKKGWIPLVYVFLTLVMTYPLLFRLGSHYVGTGSDLLIFPWNDWWCRKCLIEGRNPLFTTWLFYPQGVSLVYHNFAWLNTGLWLPLSPLIGPVAAYNCIFLFNLALGGIGLHYLAHYLTRDHRAAFIAGLIFAFWPCRMSHYNHPNMVSIGWVPLFFLFLIRTIREEPTRRKLKCALLAGLFLALTGLARWLHLMFTGGMLLVYLGYSALFERQSWKHHTLSTLGALASMFGLALLLIVPLLSPLVTAQFDVSRLTFDAQQGVQQGLPTAADVFSTDPDLYSTDLVSYFVPDRGHPLLKPWLSDLWSRMRRGSYLGYSVLALVVMGLLKGQRDRGLWLVIGIGLFVLALGPELQMAGRRFNVALPYAWVQDWPMVQVVRHPNRFNVLLSLPLAVLAGYGVAWLLPRLKRPWVWAVGLSVLVLFEYLPWPYPTVRLSVPSFYHQLAQEPGDFAILDLPMGARTVAKSYMYYATFHGKPLVEGHVSRLPVSAYDFVDTVPLLYGLRQNNEMDPALGDVSRQLSALADASVRYLILHPSLVPPEQLARWRSWLAIAPMFEDPDTVVYRTQPQYGQDFLFVEETGFFPKNPVSRPAPATMGDGIGIISATLTGVRQDVRQDVWQGLPTAAGSWLEATLVWGTRSAPGQDWLARLSLVSSSGSEAQWVDFEPCAGWPTSQWGTDGVARGYRVLHIDPFIEGGTYTVTVGLVDPATGARVDRALSVGQIEIQVVERAFERPEIKIPVEAIFGGAGDTLQLLGYDLEIHPPPAPPGEGGEDAGQALHLTLHWQARQRMEVAYKFFVHLLDPETGELVAQADVMPRDWTYPTTWWEKGEVVSDEIVLAVSDVPPGIYRVTIGVYNPETGARLPVTAGSGAGEPDQDQLMLLERLALP